MRCLSGVFEAVFQASMIYKLPPDEIRASILGVIKVFKGEADALLHFNLSAEGFWRSFQAIWLILVPYFIAMLAERHTLAGNMALELSAFPSGQFFFAKLSTIGLEWIMMPIALALLAGVLAIKREYSSYIIVRNWASVVMTWVFFIPTLASIAKLISIEVVLFIQLGLLGLVVFFSFRIARLTLQKPASFCVALVGIDFMAGLLLSRLIWKSFGPTEVVEFLSKQPIQ